MTVSMETWGWPVGTRQKHLQEQYKWSGECTINTMINQNSESYDMIYKCLILLEITI